MSQRMKLMKGVIGFKLSVIVHFLQKGNAQVLKLTKSNIRQFLKEAVTVWYGNCFYKWAVCRPSIAHIVQHSLELSVRYHGRSLK